jgi:hypothetical protein
MRFRSAGTERSDSRWLAAGPGCNLMTNWFLDTLDR